MAGGPDSVWVPFLLICIFHAADGGLVFQRGNPNILPGIPTVNKGLCAEMEEKLASMNTQLQETTQRNSQLDEDASALRREVRQLALKLSTCSSAMTSIAGSYHAQLQSKMNHLLEAIDSEMFQVLKIVALTSDVRALRKKFESAVNSNGNSTERTALQKELNTKTSELKAMNEKLNRSSESMELILEIISLQHQIWDLRQTELSGKDAVNVDSRRLALQEILDRKLSELQRHEATLSAMLEMISVRSQLRTITKRIKVLTERIEMETSNAERQLRQKTEQLRKLILLLSTRENDKNLTREILRLQGEVDTLSKLVSSKTTPTITGEWAHAQHNGLQGKALYWDFM
ncbi:microtubule-associated tumor suppressor 1 homolog [Fundulus heteroclitus]|uniref:microtubule-associated tumor suppressor 1 homolog n=1 Tax=Fundulus heteroclitus TaxID=8078 RepID=UPI00165BBACF|nr:microtubule-associated tumor suppressor 1 homolog [Fundulus heteroclitus]